MLKLKLKMKERGVVFGPEGRRKEAGPCVEE